MKNRNIILTTGLGSQLVDLMNRHHDCNIYSTCISEALHTMSIGCNLYDKIICDQEVPDYVKDFFQDCLGYSDKTKSDVIYNLTEVQKIVEVVMVEVAVRYHNEKIVQNQK